MEVAHIPLVGNITIRGLTANPILSTKGQVFINHEFFKFKNPFTGKETLFSQKRPGVKPFNTTSGYTTIHKVWPWWSDNSGLGGYVYTGHDSATGRSKFTIARTSSSYVYTSGTTVISSVEETRSGGNPGLILERRGVDYIHTDAAATVTAITVPANTTGPIVTIKGWAFAGNKDGKIYNSNLNDPLTGYTDFLTADMFPDGLRSLVNYNDFLVGFGPNSLEFFEVTSNTSGSPLRYRPEFHSLIGINQVSPFVDYTKGNNTIYWSAVGSAVAPGSIYYFDGVTPKKLSSPYLQNLNFNGIGPTFITMGPKEYLVYQLNIDSVDYALIYDLDMELWHFWKPASGVSVYWPSLGTNATSTDLSALVVFNSTLIGEMIREQDAGVFQDSGTSVSREVVTSSLDFGSKNWKTIDYIKIIGDQATSSSNIAISWSDDDGQNFSTPVNIDMSQVDPVIRGCGATKRRIIKLSDILNGEFRYVELEIGYTLGDT